MYGILFRFTVIWPSILKRGKLLKTSRCMICILLFFKFTLIRAIATGVIHCDSGIFTILISFNTVTSSTTLWIIFVWIFIDRICWRIIASRSPFGPITPATPLNNNVSCCCFSWCRCFRCRLTCSLTSCCGTYRRCNLNIWLSHRRWEIN